MMASADVVPILVVDLEEAAGTRDVLQILLGKLDDTLTRLARADCVGVEATKLHGDLLGPALTVGAPAAALALSSCRSGADSASHTLDDDC